MASNLMKIGNIDNIDTIAAIATPIGQGAVGIIKISGPKALDITQVIFKPSRTKELKRLNSFPSHTIHYGYIVDPVNNRKIDEVLVSVMRAPSSYTKEDVVEINAHGGRVAIGQVLDLIISEGARLAEPGEFTKRAFLNGRIDLAQAEAVIDLINAQSQEGLSILLNTLEGTALNSLYLVRREIKDWQVKIETELNFEEGDIISFSKNDLTDDISRWSKTINTYIQSYEASNALIHGIKLVITGKTNVGKSSLMNSLLKKERSIVTSIPGTTTDVIEDSFYLDGILIRLLDTAGFGEPKNEIEQEGIRRSSQYISLADLIMVVIDASDSLDEDDKYVLKLISSQDKPFLIVLNKTDLVKNDKDHLWGGLLEELVLDSTPILRVSAAQGKGIGDILKVISSRCLPDHKDALTIGINLRQKGILIQIKNSLRALRELMVSGQMEELVAEEFRSLAKLFGQFQGDQIHEDLLDEIFSKFCIGK